ncbi:hypothetical protein DM01DRAFT_1367868 [Hesseltinella vesiculosa]|uniref:Ion transport domain-containing protein n=1 Tax=Hesseltinella vesiculosa TaxID=101127 RepID=A0A1X2GCK6_9FUNG|nr:hypothetical protein DM01DRAFT_1367868 [Hesseltinella vesiculosa]
MDDEERQHMLSYSEDSDDDRTQHSLTRSELVKGMANRLMYSNYYIALYLGLGLLSFISIVMSIKETCPSLMFIIFEAIINFAMILEVTIRLLALGRTYWQSVWNMIDIVLVALCVITLIVLATGCSDSERSEAIFDTVLLVIRNCFQFFRLFMMARKNQYSIHAKTTRINFDNLPVDRHVSVDFSTAERDRALDESFLEDEDDDSDDHRRL